MKPIYLAIAISTLFMSIAPNAFGAFGDITLTSPKMVNTSGQELTSFQTDQQIGIESTLTNHASSEQKFTYLVQVIDKYGATEYLEGTSASMVSSQSFTASQVWIPKEPGQYTIQIFVWESLKSDIPLTNVLQTQITVNP